MLLGYARVSTDEQDTRLQRDALTRAGCERIYEEKASGAKENRPELTKLLDHARNGDVVIVWKLDRLARSLTQLITTATLLADRGVELRSVTEQIDTTSPSGKLTFHLFAALAEFERDLIRQVQHGKGCPGIRGQLYNAVAGGGKSSSWVMRCISIVGCSRKTIFSRGTVLLDVR